MISTNFVDYITNDLFRRFHAWPNGNYMQLAIFQQTISIPTNPCMEWITYSNTRIDHLVFKFNGQHVWATHKNLKNVVSSFVTQEVDIVRFIMIQICSLHEKQFPSYHGAPTSNQSFNSIMEGVDYQPNYESSNSMIHKIGTNCSYASDQINGGWEHFQHSKLHFLKNTKKQAYHSP